MTIALTRWGTSERQRFVSARKAARLLAKAMSSGKRFGANHLNLADIACRNRHHISDRGPTARRLFKPVPSKRRPYVPVFAWLIASAVAVLAGQRIVDWIDRNI